MKSADIRRIFLDFFRDRGHRIVPSSSLVPDDPTLLLTTAGMVQFKPFFLGQKVPEYPRAASVQKSARTTDIDRVGHTARHLTFFEMLGNFSFGDYYKREACVWAWELLTGPFGLDPARLWVTIFETDEEAAEVWRDVVGVPPDRIIRRGAEDNFWSMGVAGPCGPCSEIYFDRRAKPGDFVDNDDVPEIWNLVFMQHLQDDAGNIVGDLPRRNIDTGMGLERLAAVLQNVATPYETDVLRPIVAKIEELSGRRYGENERADVSLRIVAEHARTSTFLIADGVFPSNEWRGYVLRRLLRRAVRHARTLGVDTTIMPAMVDAVIETMGEAYPELETGSAFIKQVASAEEDHFRDTLRQGLSMIDEAIASARAGKSAVPGDVAFKLHDTYGFPLDLTVEIAHEAGLEVDRAEFERLMDEQRRRAREGRKVGKQATAAYQAVAAERGPTKFLGYERDEADSTLAAIIADGERVPAAEEGAEVEVVLDATPFYPEGGGQVGDSGRILVNGAELEVLDTQQAPGDLIVHRARVARGEAVAGRAAHAIIDLARRAATMRSHTATHVLHWVLRDTVGPHARQAGSLVAPGRLRFDFPGEAVPQDTLRRIESRVNELLVADSPVLPYETTMEEARRRGALMLFEEKYGDIVRVVEIGDYSVELCGGTHVTHTSQVGPVYVAREESIGAGLRRIEAATGLEALESWRKEQTALRQIAELVRVSPEEAPDRVRKLLEDLKRADEQLRKARTAGEREEARALGEKAARVGDASVLVAERPGLGVPALRELALAARQSLDGPGVVVMGSSDAGKAAIAAAVTKDLVARGVSARALIADAAKAIGGGAGGKDDVASGGGNRPEAVQEALRLAEAAARAALA